MATLAEWKTTITASTDDPLFHRKGKNRVQMSATERLAQIDTWADAEFENETNATAKSNAKTTLDNNVDAIRIKLGLTQAELDDLQTYFK